MVHAIIVLELAIAHRNGQDLIVQSQPIRLMLLRVQTIFQLLALRRTVPLDLLPLDLLKISSYHSISMEELQW